MHMSGPSDNEYDSMAGDDGILDTTAWFSGLVGANTGSYVEAIPLGGDHAMLDEQWMNLMRDTGLLTPGGMYNANKQQQQHNGIVNPGITEGMTMLF